jgi:hypothetical protein
LVVIQASKFAVIRVERPVKFDIFLIPFIKSPLKMVRAVIPCQFIMVMLILGHWLQQLQSTNNEMGR